MTPLKENPRAPGAKNTGTRGAGKVVVRADAGSSLRPRHPSGQRQAWPCRSFRSAAAPQRCINGRHTNRTGWAASGAHRRTGPRRTTGCRTRGGIAARRRQLDPRAGTSDAPWRAPWTGISRSASRQRRRSPAARAPPRGNGGSRGEGEVPPELRPASRRSGSLTTSGWRRAKPSGRSTSPRRLDGGPSTSPSATTRRKPVRQRRVSPEKPASTPPGVSPGSAPGRSTWSRCLRNTGSPFPIRSPVVPFRRLA